MDYDDDSTEYTYNKKPTVFVAVHFSEGINVLDVEDVVSAKVDEYKETLPKDIGFNVIVNNPDEVEESVNNFVVNLIESIVIVLAVVFIGMSLKNAVIVSVVIPLSIFICFVCMKMLKIDVEFVSLAALITSLGMLVDNAIVISDAIQVRIDNGESNESACINGVKEVAIPVLASLLTTIAMFSIFLYFPGVMGQFMFSLPAIIIITLIASYVLSLTVTPVLCYVFLKKSKEQKQNDEKGKIVQAFDRVNHKVMQHKVPVLIVMTVMVLVSLFVLKNFSKQMMPYSVKQIVDIDIETSNLNDIRKSKQAVADVENILDKQPEVQGYLSAAGGNIPKYDFAIIPSADATNKGNIMVMIDMSKSKRFKGSSAKADFVEYLQTEMNNNITNARTVCKELAVTPQKSKPVQLTITGDDISKLNDKALEIENIMKDMEGMRSIYCDTKYKAYSYYADMKDEDLKALGLTKSAIQGELNIALSGKEATVFRKDSMEYPVYIKSDIDNKDKIENFMVKSSVTGKKHMVKQVADIDVKEDYNVITTYNGRRSVTINAYPEVGYSAIDLENDLIKKVKDIDLGDDVEIEWQGDVDIFSDIKSSLGTGGAFAVCAIILIIYIQFGSAKQTFIVCCSMPFALTGGVIGLKILGEQLSIFSIIGIASLLGVVVNNAIVLVDYINGARAEGLSVDEACKKAVGMRFRPIVLSSGTTILGLLPLAISGGIIFRGMSVAFMCGLLGCTVFTLIIIPMIFSMMYKDDENSSQTANKLIGKFNKVYEKIKEKFVKLNGHLKK